MFYLYAEGIQYAAGDCITVVFASVVFGAQSGNSTILVYDGNSVEAPLLEVIEHGVNAGAAEFGFISLIRYDA